MVVGGGLGVLAQYLADAHWSGTARQLMWATLASTFVGFTLLGVLLASRSGASIRAFVAGFVGAIGSMGLYTADGVNRLPASLAYVMVLAPALLLSGLVGGAAVTVIIRRRHCDAVGSE
jgi:hypothetical protein